MEKFEELKHLIETLTEDVNKFYHKGNSTAGTRVRQGMQTIKSLAQEIRVEVSETKKDKKTKNA
jgi:hypothetical protein